MIAANNLSGLDRDDDRDDGDGSQTKWLSSLDVVLTIFQYNNIDLQQVFLLQSEAHENKTLMFICEYFRLHGRVKH